MATPPRDFGATQTWSGHSGRSWLGGGVAWRVSRFEPKALDKVPT